MSTARPYYTRKDRVGNVRTCDCVPDQALHEFCANCLILVGPEHIETALYAWDLPVMTDAFSELSGVWSRRELVVPQGVCGVCYEALAEGQEPTIRLAPRSPDDRAVVAGDWMTRHGVTELRGRYLGGFVRAVGGTAGGTVRGSDGEAEDSGRDSADAAAATAGSFSGEAHANGGEARAHG